MYRARQGLIAHIDAAKATLGLVAVKAYAGEIARVRGGDPMALSGICPCALALHSQSTKRTSELPHEVDLLIVQQTLTQSEEANADEALQLAEGVADWLLLNQTWTDEAGAAYLLDGTRGIEAETLLMASDYSIVQLTIPFTQNW